MKHHTKISDLDRERANSMADEGGVAAATLDEGNLTPLIQPSLGKGLLARVKLENISAYLLPSAVVIAGIGLFLNRNKLAKALS